MRAANAQKPKRPYLQHERPLFFAHRGGSLLAPENTLVAFERGLSYGADALELDVHMTRDGELVVFHDVTLDRTTDGTGPIAAHTLEELRRFDAGYRFTPDGGQTHPFRGQGVTIPTLAEVFARFPATRINVEIKQSTPGRERRLWELIQEHQVEDRVMVGSFVDAALARFRALTGGRVATSAGSREVRNFLVAALCRTTRLLRPAYDALQVPDTYGRIRVVSRTSVEAAHRLGLEVHVWTVNDRATMEQLLHLGVDGLMSDRPDILAEALTPRPPSPSSGKGETRI
jgi:glycerophosphoryl diester phosphodiesterase